jgi:acetate---CoA ligase (ADP-forming)
MNLNNFFNPKSIAVIGASNDKNKVGYALVSNLLGGAKRNIYPVSISEKEILGLKAYASIKDIKENIDLALIAVRADIVPGIMEECASKKVQTVIIIAAGFKEAGPTGIELEKKITGIARKNNIALLGPNCLGTIDTHTDLNASFASLKPKKGHVAFLSQSGALGTAVLDKALAEGIGFSKFISLGNEAILSEIEFLKYLRDDEETKAILMYVERLPDGPEFMKLASEITKQKPIVLIKAGRGARGQRAVMSHTGSLAPEDKVFKAACKQSGIIVVESIREFFNMAKLFELGILKPLQKLIVLTNAGGPAVIATDLIDLSRSLSLIELSDKTKDQLKKVLPTMAGVNNPVDIIGDALGARYESALKILVEEKEAEAIITLLTPQMMTEVEATAKLLSEYNKKKLIIPVFIGGPSIEKGLATLKENGLINFAFPKDAIEALDNIAMSAKKSDTTNHKNLSTPSTKNIASTLKMASFADTHKLLDDYGLSLSGVLVKEKSDLEKAMKKNGGDTYVLKVMSEDVIHKTDMGAVKLNIKSIKEAEAAWDEMLSNVQAKNPKARIEGILMQPKIIGKEVIIGMKRDPTFGPTILFGLGGIFTEVLKDTSIRIAPVSKEAAMEMIREIHGINILTGIRNEKSVNLEKLAEIIVQISKLSTEHPEVKEIDLNPVMIRPDGADIVDARVMI